MLRLLNSGRVATSSGRLRQAAVLLIDTGVNSVKVTGGGYRLRREALDVPRASMAALAPSARAAGALTRLSQATSKALTLLPADSGSSVHHSFVFAAQESVTARSATIAAMAAGAMAGAVGVSTVALAAANDVDEGQGSINGGLGQSPDAQTTTTSTMEKQPTSFVNSTSNPLEGQSPPTSGYSWYNPMWIWDSLWGTSQPSPGPNATDATESPPPGPDGADAGVSAGAESSAQQGEVNTRKGGVTMIHNDAASKPREDPPLAPTPSGPGRGPGRKEARRGDRGRGRSSSPNRPPGGIAGDPHMRPASSLGEQHPGTPENWSEIEALDLTSNSAEARRARRKSKVSQRLEEQGHPGEWEARPGPPPGKRWRLGGWHGHDRQEDHVVDATTEAVIRSDRTMPAKRSKMSSGTVTASKDKEDVARKEAGDVSVTESRLNARLKDVEVEMLESVAKDSGKEAVEKIRTGLSWSHMGWQRVDFSWSPLNAPSNTLPEQPKAHRLVLSNVMLDMGRFKSQLLLSGVYVGGIELNNVLVYIQARRKGGEWTPLEQYVTPVPLERTPWILCTDYGRRVGLKCPLEHMSTILVKIPVALGTWTASARPDELHVQFVAVPDMPEEAASASWEDWKQALEAKVYSASSQARSLDAMPNDKNKGRSIADALRVMPDPNPPDSLGDREAEAQGKVPVVLASIVVNFSVS